MPSLPGRSCQTPGCTSSTYSGSRCAACKKARYKQQDDRRLSPLERGYDESHKRLRILCFERDLWKCVDCGWEPDTVRQFREFELGDPPQHEILNELRLRKNRNDRHLHADHQIPIEQRPDLRLELDNYRTRCSTCHSRKTMRELRER